MSEGNGKLTAASLDGITALPDHGADGARKHVYNVVSFCGPIEAQSVPTLDEATEEGLAGEILVWAKVSTYSTRFERQLDAYSAARGAPWRGSRASGQRA